VSEQQKSYAEMSDSEKKKEDWMNSKWRPMMGWMYMIVCMSDFVLFPILWSLIQAIGGGQVHTQWQPITLQGAGLFHIAMGAVLGIAAFGRTQEKLGGANNGGAQVGTTYTPPAPIAAPAPKPMPSFSAPTPAPSFSAPAPTTSFGGSSSQFTAAPTTSSTGKPMPMQPDQPEL
jgi:hypothetical protein